MRQVSRHIRVFRWLLTLSLVSVAALAGCSSSNSASSSSSSSPSAPAQLTYWARGANQAINQQLVNAWNATHSTKVTLLAVPDAVYAQKFAAAVQAGDPPDVVTLDVATIALLARSNALADITAQAHALPYFGDLTQSYIKESTYNGAIYALPENVDASTLWWNKALFTRAGLDPNKPPATYAELISDARKINALGGGVSGFYFAGQCSGCNSYTFSPMVWASGGDFISADGTQSTLASPAVVSGLTLYQQLWQDHLVPASAKDDTGANWVSSFGSGKIGIEGLGAFAIAQMTKSYPNVNYGIAPFPGQNGGASAYTGGDVVAIPRGSKHAAAAWQFAEWSLSAAAQVGVYAKSGGLVARSDLANNQYAKDPHVAAEQHALSIGRLPNYYPNSAEIDAPTGPYAKAFQAIVFGGASAEPALKTAQGQVQQLLSQGQ